MDFNEDSKRKTTSLASKTALEFYKEFQNDEFYKHYLQSVVRDMKHLEFFNEVDNLEKDDNPNFGLFRDNVEKIFDQ